MTHRRALLVSLAFAALFAAGYSMLAPQGLRGWGSIEIVDISPGERDGQSIRIYINYRTPGARFGSRYLLGIVTRSDNCDASVEWKSGYRAEYSQGEHVEILVLSPVCPADDYEMTVVLRNVLDQEIARDTMRFSVPPSP